MRINSIKNIIIVVSIVFFSAPAALQAQLNTIFEKIFFQILEEDLFSEVSVLGGDPFENAATRANEVFTPAMNSLIATNVSSFPLTSTIAGVSFDMSSGAPEMSMETLGPIYAETAETLGQWNVNLGVNYSHYDLTSLRGLNLDDIQFTVTTPDFSGDGTLGDIPVEVETIDIFPHLKVKADVVVTTATIGVMNNLDFGIAVPVVSLSMQGRAKGVINSVSFYQFGLGLINFNNDPFNPLFVDHYDYSESITDVGDIAFKLKYAFLRNKAVDLAALATIRIPTGSADNFLSTGEANTKLTVIASKKNDRFGGHINVGYEKRSAAFDSDELELNLGFEQKLSENITFVGDFLAEFDLNDSNLQFPGSEVLMAVYQRPPFDTSRTEIEVPVTNIRNSRKDHFIYASIGFKIAASHRFSGFANILMPMNDGGLRARVIPTFGLAFSL